MTLQVFDKVHCLDFSALYPNIIRQFNLSPEFEYPINYTSNEETNLVIKKEDFVYEETGVLTNIVSQLIDMRKDYRSRGMESEQLATKIAVNSLYGVLSQHHAKYVLGGTHLASTVTYMGRTILHNLVDRLPKHGLTVIYGKTDSIFVISEEIDDGEKVLEIGQKVTDEIVKELSGRDNQFIKFDYEEYLSKMILVNKNNYVKIYTDNSIKTKGATFYSTSSSDYEVDVMNFLIREIISDKNFNKESLIEKSNEFLEQQRKKEDIDYFAIKHKPRMEKINKFDSVEYMLNKDMNIEYGFNHNAVVCNYGGNSHGIIVYPLGYKIENEYKPDRKWLRSINSRVIRKLDLPEKFKQSSLDVWF